eukprot:gene13751-10789_t
MLESDAATAAAAAASHALLPPSSGGIYGDDDTYADVNTPEQEDLPPAPPPRPSSGLFPAHNPIKPPATQAPPPPRPLSSVNLQQSSGSGRAQTMDAASAKVLSQWQLLPDMLQLTDKIGEGNFGDVWRGIYGGDKPVAVKSLKLDHTGNPGSVVQEFLLEAKILMEFIEGPNILKMIGVTTVLEPWFIVTELAAFGDLLKVCQLCKKSSIDLRPDEMLNCAGQISVGMRFLARRQFIHRDLAARNCLVMANGAIKIGDFGMSRALSGDYYQLRGDAQLPVRWMAFESIMHQKFTIRRPYGEMSNHIIGYEVQKGTRPFHPSGCSEDVYGLMLRCWSETPEDRPAFGEIVDKIRDMETAARAAAGGMNPRCIGELSVSRTPDTSESSPYRTLPNGAVMEYAGFGGNNDTLLKKSGHLTYSGLGGGGGGIAQEYAGFAGTGQTYAAPKDSDGHATYRGTAERAIYLQGDAQDGMYLIRQSPNGKNEIVFCVLYAGQVQHYKARYLDQQRYYFYGNTFDNVQAIIDFHRINKGGKDGKGGLAVLLLTPCVRF